MKISRKEFVYQYDIKIEKNSWQDAKYIIYHYTIGISINIQLSVAVTF